MKVAPLVRMADCLLGMAGDAGKAPLVVLLFADHDAERLALLARGAFPHIPVLYCPATDALPGDGAGASAANAVQRVAALTAMGAPHDVPPILICGAEATIAAYPPSEAFVAQPPLVKLGDQIDLAELREQLIAIGYRTDERIDEPGEVGDAGAVLNVYPVDAQRPVRIELEDGRVRSLRLYDPLSQTNVEEIERASFGIASAPPVPKDAATLLAHDHEAVKLDTLDGKSWEKRRSAIDAAIAEAARHLRALAKAREAAQAPIFAQDSSEYERFVDGFPYSETTEQRAAIEAVRTDLASGKAMDRLVIGDVGFGKSEVALRAAAVVALSGTRVAVIAPTTLLARQHFEEFTRRFKRVGIEIVSLSRANTAAERKAARAALADGTARIVVGTTAIAGKGTSFDAGIGRIQVGPGGIALTPRSDIALQPGAGQRVSDERFIADRRPDTRPIENAANALDALIGDAA